MDDAQTGAPPRLAFMNALVTIHLSRGDSAAGVSLIEHRMARDFSVPLHRHDEDETFYVLDGTVRFQAGDKTLDLKTGASLHVPRRTAHAFKVLSPEARFLTVTTGRFEEMVRAFATPAASADLPPQVPSTAADTERLVALCTAHGIDFVGPPID
jgi:quercetin dioxygenase-like cupin family protein